MDLHQFVCAAETAGYLITIDREVDPNLEIAHIAAELDGRPVLFTRVKGSAYPMFIGACSDRRYFGLALGTPADQVIFRLADALAAPQPPQIVESAPCQEVVEPVVDLTAIPFLTHYASDGGAYATAAVAFIDDPDTGPNASLPPAAAPGPRRLSPPGWSSGAAPILPGAKPVLRGCRWRSASVCRCTYCSPRRWRPRPAWTR